MRRALILAILTVLAACLPVLSSCVKLERQPVDKRFYSLDVARPGEAVPAPKAGAALLVRRLQVSPRVAPRELVYRMGESGWTADYYNLFFVPPADMLSQDLRTWLRTSGLYANVVDPASLLEPTLVLEGNVVGLHGDFSQSPAQAVVEMQFLLLDNAGAERAVLLTRDIRRTAPLAGNSPQELVRALRVAVGECFGELEGALRQIPARASAKAPAK